MSLKSINTQFTKADPGTLQNIFPKDGIHYAQELAKNNSESQIIDRTNKRGETVHGIRHDNGITKVITNPENGSQRIVKSIFDKETGTLSRQVIYSPPTIAEA